MEYIKNSNRFLLVIGILLIFFSCSQGNDNKKLEASAGKKASNYENLLNGTENDDKFFDFSLAEDPDEEALSDKLQQKLDTVGLNRYFPKNSERNSLKKKLESFYEDNGYRLVWTSSGEATAQASELIDTILNIEEDGLNPGHYHLDQLVEKNKILNDGADDALCQLIELDLLLTASYLTLASDMISGRLNPYKFENRWIPDVPERDLKEHLEEALENEEIATSIQNLAPGHPQYEKLKDALVKYKEIEANGGWEIIRTDSLLQLGDSTHLISKFKRRLVISEDLKEYEKGDGKEYVFDEELETAVTKFQRRHGIAADGIIGPNTLEMLNIPVEDKIIQIAMNIERLRWMPRNMTGKYILVNVPEFVLRIYSDDEVLDEMKVIVGREYNSTPIFSDSLEYLVLSPDWTLPLSIARQNILPRLKEDPGYLQRNHYEIYEDWSGRGELMDPFSVDWDEVEEEDFRYRVVQMPGPWNALGQVKFMMPNNMAIYLHDTPTEHLFDEKERGFSHGCIRVERPLDLTEFLLKDHPEWDTERIEQNLNRDNPLNVVLPEKIPVHIVYKTTWVDETGEIHFLQDIYNHDAIQTASLENTLELN